MTQEALAHPRTVILPPSVTVIAGAVALINCKLLSTKIDHDVYGSTGQWTI